MMYYFDGYFVACQILQRLVERLLVIQLAHYGYVDNRLDQYDHDRFCHSQRPAQCGAQFDEDPKGIDCALRDIASGEEITVDYLLVEGHRPNKT